MARPKKTDEEFFQEYLQFYLRHGLELRKIDPDITDLYNTHSFFKLVCIHYWVGLFCPICHNQLKKRWGHKVVYIDTMAGSGVTSTASGDEYFCGSCTGAVLRSTSINYPFDSVIAVEIDNKKALTLERRLHSIIKPESVAIYNSDIMEVSPEIVRSLTGLRHRSYIVIDPHGFEGMKWRTIYPLLSCKGDAMITWFEHDAWRIKNAAISERNHPAARGQGEMLTELIGPEWVDAKEPSDLTNIFISRVQATCRDKNVVAKVEIPHKTGSPYWMLLFTGGYKTAPKLAREWEENVTKRIQSHHGAELPKLIDVEMGRQKTLFNQEFYNNK
jgi:three-Cys-motif partner protein